eukprot:TRINITY_DN2177_c0_g1_i1.p1 TRINITY_DN2177_c0_g1~~TRINITY_DN2177_c0_g1_i1.p1  ORF type:complete len:235 (+),score=29.49 TRINITY_DN2177_c0_g1_i1:81-785(+)
MKPVQVWRIAFVLILQQLQGLSEGINNLKSVADTADLLIQRGNERGGGWGYEVGSERGPFKWGNMSSDWALCSTGKQQSPIRILSFDVAKNEKLKRLHTLYHYAPATLLNDGRILRLKWEGGFLLIEESLYELFEVQFHTPSEHTINGKKYAMEMQLMHRNRVNNAIAVVAILFKLGEDRNKFLDQVGSFLIPASGCCILVSVFICHFYSGSAKPYSKFEIIKSHTNHNYFILV